MLRNRIIPTLLLKNSSFIKTVRFDKFQYIGDSLNTLKIFNDLEADEICLFDIFASLNNREPNYKLLEKLASECFMPLTYGGGVYSLKQMEKLFKIGFEKISISSHAFLNPELVKEASNSFGSQAIIVTIDVRKNFLGQRKIRTHHNTKTLKLDPVLGAQLMEQAGAGELIINSIDRDGTFSGLDIELGRNICDALDIPVVLCGGAGSISDIDDALQNTGATAIAVGSMVVYQGSNKSVLINYPNDKRIARV